MSWTKVLGFGLIAGGVALGCTVTTTSDNNDAGSTGGVASTGGAGGSSSGGAATGGGGAASTGGAGTGGSTAYVCNASASDACVACLNTKCCDAMKACRDNATCWGGGDNVDPGTSGELFKFHDCMTSTYSDAGTVNQSDVARCAGAAAAGAAVDNTTFDVIQCLAGTGDGATQCDQACYNVRIQ